MTTELLVRLALSGVAATLAAIAAERALRDVGRPARFAWAGALLLSAAFSLLLVSGGRLPFGVPALVSDLFAPAPMQPKVAYEPSVVSAPIDYALIGWLLLSSGIALALAGGVARQRRRVRGGRRGRVDGVDVVVTSTDGPAVCGFIDPRIVVPAWLLDRPEAERRLVLRHEAEHVAARDPLLSAAMLLVVCVVPWNPLLWYQFRRLRLAIEIDCDARVLRRGDAREYGRLLVDVADRLARGTPLATALAFPRNFLEWRIRMIVNRRNRPLRAAAWMLGAGALLVAACADAGDPVAAEAGNRVVAEEPITVSDLVESPDATIEFVPSVDEAEVPFNGRLMLRTPAPEGQDGYQTREDEGRMRVQDLRPTTRPAGTIVPFRATIGDDGRPTSVEFDDAVPAETQEQVRGALQTWQMRRSSTDPDAPIEASVMLHDGEIVE